MKNIMIPVTRLAMRIIPKSVADVYSVYADYQFVHIFRNADASKPNDKVSWQLFISRKFFIKFLCWTIRIKPKVFIFS